jgi:hypothetical protein
VRATIDGFNAAICAYGQTSSGKTFTILGKQGSNGSVCPGPLQMWVGRAQSCCRYGRGTTVGVCRVPEPCRFSIWTTVCSCSLARICSRSCARRRIRFERPVWTRTPARAASLVPCRAVPCRACSWPRQALRRPMAVPPLWNGPGVFGRRQEPDREYRLSLSYLEIYQVLGPCALPSTYIPLRPFEQAPLLPRFVRTAGPAKGLAVQAAASRMHGATLERAITGHTPRSKSRTCSLARTSRTSKTTSAPASTTPPLGSRLNKHSRAS